MLSSTDGIRRTLAYQRRDGSTVHCQVSTFSIRSGDEKTAAQGFIIRDMTEQRRIEQERQALQEQVIVAQERAIRELSTPLIPLAEGLVLMPLVGEINFARVAQMMDTLLGGIAEQKAPIAILDITGARHIDAKVADALIRSARAASLLGAEVVLTGIGHDIAQTLVEIGGDLSTVKTRSTLESAISYAMNTRHSSGGRDGALPFSL